MAPRGFDSLGVHSAPARGHVRPETMTETMTEDVALAIGRVLSADLSETEVRPDLREASLATAWDPETDETHYLVLSSSRWAKNGRIWPSAMAVLAEWGIGIQTRPQDQWSHERYAEWDLYLPVGLVDAFEHAVSEWGVPDPSKDWSEDECAQWARESVQDAFRARDTDEEVSA